MDKQAIDFSNEGVLRRDMAREALLEIDELLGAIGASDGSDMVAERLIRALRLRMQQLVSVALGGLDEAHIAPREMADVLYGEHGWLTAE